MYRNYNKNPVSRRGDDCTVRAIATVMNKPWEEVYLDLCLYGLREHDMPSANFVWSKYLIDKGYTRHIIPNTCPHCYSVEQFANDHPIGSYILALHGHAVACIDGDYIDTWNSGQEIPIFYWQKGE